MEHNIGTNSRNLKIVYSKEAFTNDVINHHLRWGFIKDDGGGDAELKMTLIFYIVSGKIFKQFDLEKFVLL